MKITCPKCGMVLKAPDEMAGKRGQCPGCGMVLLMPTLSNACSSRAPGCPGVAEPAGAEFGNSGLEEVLRAVSNHEHSKEGFDLSGCCDALLHALLSIDAGTKTMPPNGWTPIRSAAEALLTLGRLDAVIPVMKAWACTTLHSHANINKDAVTLLERCGPTGVSALCEVVEHWLQSGPSGAPLGGKFREHFMPVLEALEQLGPAAAPSKPLVVRCLAFGHSDSAFQAEVRAAADRIAWNINLYALD